MPRYRADRWSLQVLGTTATANPTAQRYSYQEDDHPPDGPRLEEAAAGPAGAPRSPVPC
ncbi:hypothetical protein ACQ86F_03730 [Streptomyces venezuelae ATCC 10712]